MAAEAVHITKNSKLFSYNILDIKDELDERLEKCHKNLRSITTSLRENEMYEKLNMKVSQSVRDHEDTTLALLFAILTDSTTAHKSYSTLALVTKDSMGVVVHIAELLILEKFPRLLETTRLQLMWLTRELIQTGVMGADRLCFAFLKQMPAGSVAAQDVWLAENLLNLFLDNRKWLEEQSPLVTSAVFTYLSILPSHLSLLQLKDLEIDFVISLLRSKFLDCMQIGRDLIRLLQNVSRIPEFTLLWHDLLNKPHSLEPSFTGVAQILSRRTSRRFVAGRIVTDSEIKMNFLLSKVKFGQHKKYQEWFQKKYLSTPDSLAVIPELIRFICCVIHPPNEVLGSDILPRWAFIGWLLSIAQPHPVIFSNSKLALFYDWLCYSSDSDNIMNIEPAILLMFHSLHSHPQLTMTLLDFLCRLGSQFSSHYNVINSIQSAFKDAEKKGVLHSLNLLLAAPKYDARLSQLLKDTFPDLFSTTTATEVSHDEPQLEIEEEKEEEEEKVAEEEREDKEGEEVGELSPPVMIDDEEMNYNDIDVWANVLKLPGTLRDKMEEFRAHSDSIPLLKDILTLLQSKFSDQIELVSQPLVHCLTEQFEEPLTKGEALDVVLKFDLVKLISMMREVKWKFGYHLLHHLYQTNRLSQYSQYLPNQETSIDDILLRDLKEISNENTELFFILLPTLYSTFSELLTGCTDMINIIVSHIDPHQLNNLIIQISLRKLAIFGKSKLQDTIVASLQWDSFEQFCVWQLLGAEGYESHHIVTLLRHISPTDHPEAISGAILLLKQEPSIPAAVGNLLSFSTSHSQVVSAILCHWINNKPNKMAKFIDYCLTKVLKLSEPLPTLTPMLDHLEKALSHLINNDVFKGVECILSHSLDKIFNRHHSLRLRYPGIISAIKEAISNATKTQKRHISSDSDEVNVRVKKRRALIIEESD